MLVINVKVGVTYTPISIIDQILSTLAITMQIDTMQLIRRLQLTRRKDDSLTISLFRRKNNLKSLTNK